MRLTVLSVGFPFATIAPRTAGGAEQILAGLDRFLIASGHASLVLAPEGSQVSGLLLPTPRVPPEITPEFQRHVRRSVRDLLAAAIERYAVDIVHLHGLDFMEYLPAADIPVVVTLHLPLPWYTQQMFRLDRERTVFVCVSQSHAEFWPRDRASGPPGLVIENGVDLNLFRPQSKKGNYVACLGRICPEKSPHLAIEAAEPSGVPLFLAGVAFGYQSHIRYFEERVAPRLTGRNRFLGEVGGRKKRELLAGARCLLVPSQAPETSSLVTMEALACGTPVVAFRSGALAHLIEDGVTGFLVNSVDEMAHAIDRVQELNSSACRQRAELSFSAQHMAHHYLDLYRSLAAGSAPQLADELVCLAC